MRNKDDDKLISLSKEKKLVDKQTEYIDWNKKENIKSKLESDIKILLKNNVYPPSVIKDAYDQIIKQVENYKANEENID